MTTAKISAKNQVVVPKETREHLHVGPGDELLFVPKGGRVIVLRKPDDVLESLRGSGKGAFVRGDRYLRRERGSWNRTKRSTR
jgi:AbrB family looped-hinge helix DNA binding protein